MEEVEKLLKMVLCNQVAIQERLVSIEDKIGRKSTVGYHDYAAVKNLKKFYDRHKKDIVERLQSVE